MLEMIMNCVIGCFLALVLFAFVQAGWEYYLKRIEAARIVRKPDTTPESIKEYKEYLKQRDKSLDELKDAITKGDDNVEAELRNSLESKSMSDSDIYPMS